MPSEMRDSVENIFSGITAPHLLHVELFFIFVAEK